MVPEISLLRGAVSEIHGSHNSGKTRELLRYIKECQEYDPALCCLYVDTGSQLRRCDMMDSLDQERLWAVFTKTGHGCLPTVKKCIRHAGLIVIDDFASCAENPWKLMECLRELAHRTGSAVLVANQKRHVKDHASRGKRYTFLPYRYNIVQMHCRYSVCLDTGSVERLDVQGFSVGEDLASLLNVC